MAKKPTVNLSSRTTEENKAFIIDVAFKTNNSMSQIISDGALIQAKKILKEFEKENK